MNSAMESACDLVYVGNHNTHLHGDHYNIIQELADNMPYVVEAITKLERPSLVVSKRIVQRSLQRCAR